MPKGQPSLLPQHWPNKGWQYQELVVEYGGSWSDALNEQGRLGWKLVTVIHDEDPKAEDRQVRLLMERPADKDWRDPEDRVVRTAVQRAKRQKKAASVEPAVEPNDASEDE